MESIIDKFLRGELTEIEQLEFDAWLGNSEFDQLLKEKKDLIEILKEKDRIELKKMLQKNEVDRKDKEDQNTDKTAIDSTNLKNSKSYKLPLWLKSIAAIFIFSAIIYNINKSFNNTPNFDELYAENYIPYPNVIDPITKGIHGVESVFQLYEKKSYVQVIATLENKKQLSTEEIFYLASSYMATNKIEEATINFNKIKTDQKYGQACDWYLALCCLKQSKNNCGKHFNYITSILDHPYGLKAKTILKELD